MAVINVLAYCSETAPNGAVSVSASVVVSMMSFVCVYGYCGYCG